MFLPVAVAKSVAVVLAAPKKVCPRVSTLCRWIDLGARVPSPHPYQSQWTRASKGPVFSTTGSSVPTLVNTLSYYHSPSTKPFILTPYSTQSHYRASGASLVSRGVGSTTSFVSNPYHRLRTCIIFRQLFLYMHGQLLILHHDDHRQRHTRCRDERAAELVAI